MGAHYLKPTLASKRGNIQDKSIVGLHPQVIIIFSQFSAHPLQDRQYAICNTLIICCLFLPTAMWASIYPPANALLYQSICSTVNSRLSEMIEMAAGSDNENFR